MDQFHKNPHFREFPETKIDFVFLRSLLHNGTPILINGTTAEGQILHMRLICGYENDQLIISDPLSDHKEAMDSRTLEATCAPPFGKWCMTISAKNNRPYEYL
jgi:hypothetical protein